MEEKNDYTPKATVSDKKNEGLKVSDSKTKINATEKHELKTNDSLINASKGVENDIEASSDYTSDDESKKNLNTSVDASESSKMVKVEEIEDVAQDQMKDKNVIGSEIATSEEKIKANGFEPTEPTAPKTPKNLKSASRTSDEEDEILDGENAEDAEDRDNHSRHDIPILNYEEMSLENLVGELQKLVRNEKVQSIKKHVDTIKNEFDQKFDDFLEEKKEKFIADGGNEIDFRYNSTVKTQFDEVYKEYRERRTAYYQQLEKNLKENLSSRLAIIEELKGLTTTEENIGSTYKAFKDLQAKWRNAGPIPRDNYNTVWRTYRHHTEIFYDFLHLNREMRDVDFKRNLEEKEKLVQRAEALALEPDLNRVFRELQALHKIWKEDIGPVGQANREEIWERFSDATKVLHQRRQEYYKVLEEAYEKNLEIKNTIIASISSLAENVSSNHKDLQKQIKQLEVYRAAFFNAGKVPRNKNQKTWDAFKRAVRNFNRSKNAYYKNVKQEELVNLDKKRALVTLAISLKDNENLEATTPKMKRLQADWKKIGHVPRKYSDTLWKEFKNACNHYFDRIHELKHKGREEEKENFKKKTAYLEKLLGFQPSGEGKVDLDTIKGFIDTWKTLGNVPFKKKSIDQEFNKAIDTLFGKLGLSPQKAELLRYNTKIQQLADNDNDRALENERNFIRTKIEETTSEIRQLETNLQFFSNASDDNPFVKDVVKKVDVHKVDLVIWESKLKELNILKNTIQRELRSDSETEHGSRPDAQTPNI